MAQFVIRGQDMLQFRGGADCSGAENKTLAVATLCFNRPNYLETDIFLLLLLMMMMMMKKNP
jgi:hypothetical protein